MSKTSIFEKRWLDLVFEGKNKAYGAYQLRLENRKTTLLALLYGLLFVGGIGGGGFFLSSFGSHPSPVDLPPKMPDDVITIYDATIKPPILKPIEPIESKPATATDKPEPDWRNDPTVAPPTDTNTNPDDDTKPSAPSQPEGNNSGTGTDTGNSGGSTDGNDGGTSTVDEGPALISTLDKRPEFPGGIEELYKKVAREFEKPEMYESVSIRIIVSFVVEKDGSMTDIKVLNKPGQTLEREAIRVMKTFKKKWEPGIKNGKAVRTLFTLPIVIKPE
ncbi:energy transducer TonB [Flavobacterium sp.]|uniref:energy transducer TonB n=1 Tax=Flavobacterium sp. TaxID=239 RepID=UPI0012169F35|nr:energy transducer TonB [Flavobacterium sp.]RZJ70950.1 MAG: energy transducer TonB [Flavobacterium sp.]